MFFLKTKTKTVHEPGPEGDNLAGKNICYANTRNWVWASITCTDGHIADPKSFLVSQPCGKVSFCFSERPCLKATGRVLPWSPNVCSSAHTHTCKCAHTDRYTTHTTHMLHTEDTWERDEVQISVDHSKQTESLIDQQLCPVSSFKSYLEYGVTELLNWSHGIPRLVSKITVILLVQLLEWDCNHELP